MAHVVRFGARGRYLLGAAVHTTLETGYIPVVLAWGRLAQSSDTGERGRPVRGPALAPFWGIVGGGRHV
jgi:hypothetical protein